MRERERRVEKWVRMKKGGPCPWRQSVTGQRWRDKKEQKKERDRDAFPSFLRLQCARVRLREMEGEGEQ